jgi:hypothetical protein
MGKWLSLAAKTKFPPRAGARTHARLQACTCARRTFHMTLNVQSVLDNRNFVWHNINMSGKRSSARPTVKGSLTKPEPCGTIKV